MREVIIGEKTFYVRELLAVELDGVDWTDTKNVLKKQVTLSTGMTEEDYEKLTLRERLKLVQVINEVNGLNEFAQDMGKKNN